MSGDHEFKVHHLVGELVPLFRVQDSSGVDSLVDLLLKHRSPYVTTQVLCVCVLGVCVSVWYVQVSAATAKKKIAEFSSKGAEFRKQYNELQQRQVNSIRHTLSHTHTPHTAGEGAEPSGVPTLPDI